MSSPLAIKNRMISCKFMRLASKYEMGLFQLIRGTLPLVPGHDYTAVGKADAFLFKELDLDLGTAEGKARCHTSILCHDPVAGDRVRIRISVQGIAYHTCPPGISRQPRYLPIACDFACRDPAHHGVDPFKDCLVFRMLLPFADAFAPASYRIFS